MSLSEVIWGKKYYVTYIFNIGEEWKRLLRTARNHHILYMPMD
jgi:hypothetical protein